MLRLTQSAQRSCANSKYSSMSRSAWGSWECVKHQICSGRETDPENTKQHWLFVLPSDHQQAPSSYWLLFRPSVPEQTRCINWCASRSKIFEQIFRDLGKNINSGQKRSTLPCHVRSKDPEHTQKKLQCLLKHWFRVFWAYSKLLLMRNSTTKAWACIDIHWCSFRHKNPEQASRVRWSLVRPWDFEETRENTWIFIRPRQSMDPDQAPNKLCCLVRPDDFEQTPSFHWFWVLPRDPEETPETHWCYIQPRVPKHAPNTFRCSLSQRCPALAQTRNNNRC